MSYTSRLWVAAGVAFVNGHSNQDQTLKTGLKSINHGKKRLFSSGADVSDLRSISGALNAELGVFPCGQEKAGTQAEDSLRKVMYLSCWGQG